MTRAVVDHGTRYGGVDGVRVTEGYHGEVRISSKDAAQAAASATCRFELAWPEVNCSAEARLLVRSDTTHFDVEIDLDTSLDAEPFVSRAWRERIARDHL